MSTRTLVAAASLLLAGALATHVGCTSSVDVHTMTAPNARFEQYRTFEFDSSPPVAPPTYAVSAQSPAAWAVIRETTANVLESRGYAAATGGAPGDLVVRIATGRREHPTGATAVPGPQTQAPYAGWLDNEEQDLVEGAFVIDAFDARTRTLVWHGSARAAIDANRVNDKALQRAVQNVLASFPRSGVAE
ncbi:MAG TPA: DUF4136 domain-containing protein [Polyangiaceae bacterium]|nr:DUF4136 domain-containing protein [Polyangiaceae bacterium]